MNTITIKTNVSLEAALARGKSQYGVSDVQLSDADVAALSEAGRAELATMRDGQFYPIGPDGTDLPYNGGPLDLVEADAAHVVAELEARVALRAARRRDAEAKSEQTIAAAIAAPDRRWIRDASYSILESPSSVYLTEAQRRDPRIVERRQRPSLIAEAERLKAESVASAARQKAAAEAEEAAIEQQRRSLVMDHGTPDQRERYAAGVLPWHELIDLARSILFAPFDALPAYLRKTAGDIEHDDDCEVSVEEIEISWVTKEANNHGLTSEQFAALKAVRALAKKIDGAIVDVVSHYAKLSCRCADPEWLAARVSIPFAGETLKSSYAL